MTTGTFISRLSGLTKKVESLIQSLQDSSFHPSKDQYQTLAALSLRLAAAGINLPIQIEALKNKRTEASSEEGKKLIIQAESDRRNLTTTTQLKNRGTFAKNIILFFEGQRDLVVDSEATKARKQVTRERCERIRSLSPDGIITWAEAFMATTWTANLMSKETFTYVFEHIEPDDPQVWPPDIYKILHGLAEEPLQDCQKYHSFLKAAEDDKQKAQSTNQSNKRRRVSNGAPSEGESLCSVQTSELVARTPDGQYASRGSALLIGTTEALIKEKLNTNLTTNNDKTERSQALAKIKKGGGDAFIINIEDARYALSFAEHVWEVWLTNPEHKYKAHDKKRSFLTLWISEVMGEELGQRGKLMTT